MNKLLIINEVEFPNPEESYTVDYSDKTSEYEAEDGHKTIDVIRENIATIKVSYKGLLESTLIRLVSALQVVNTVKYYDVTSGKVVTVTMERSGKALTKKYYDNGLSVWQFSFTLTEM